MVLHQAHDDDSMELLEPYRHDLEVNGDHAEYFATALPRLSLSTLHGLVLGTTLESVR